VEFTPIEDSGGTVTNADYYLYASDDPLVLSGPELGAANSFFAGSTLVGKMELSTGGTFKAARVAKHTFYRVVAVTHDFKYVLYDVLDITAPDNPADDEPPC
jgi:hypothetical protein